MMKRLLSVNQHLKALGGLDREPIQKCHIIDKGGPSSKVAPCTTKIHQSNREYEYVHVLNHSLDAAHSLDSLWRYLRDSQNLKLLGTVRFIIIKSLVIGIFSCRLVWEPSGIGNTGGVWFDNAVKWWLWCSWQAQSPNHKSGPPSSRLIHSIFCQVHDKVWRSEWFRTYMYKRYNYLWRNQ